MVDTFERSAARMDAIAEELDRARQHVQTAAERFREEQPPMPVRTPSPPSATSARPSACSTTRQSPSPSGLPRRRQTPSGSIWRTSAGRTG